MTPDMLTAAPELLGRRARKSLAPDHVTARAYGTGGADDLMVQSDVRGAPAAYPGHGTGGRDTGSTSFGGLRMNPLQRPSPWMDGTGGPGGAYGGGWSDGVLTVRDRHVLTRRGTVRNPGGGGSSMPSPDLDGPSRPQYQMVNTTESWQIGTDHTTAEDNAGQHNTVDAGGRPYPLGTQDGTMTLVMGPPLGTYREYGVRGPRGVHGPAPDVVDPNWVPRQGTGAGGGRGLVTERGAEGMQPGDRRMVYGGVPHGLHSPTVPSTVTTAARFAATPQQTPPRQDRPASSRIAGQSFSQTIVPEAQQGQVRQVPRMADPGRRPGLAGRFAPRG